MTIMPKSDRAEQIPLHVYAALKETKVPDYLFRGIHKYVRHPFKRKHSQADLVWSNEVSQILYYPANDESTESEASVFLVPSIINNSEIFDLIEEHSFIRFLNSHNTSVYLLDWGDLTKLPNLCLEDVYKDIVNEAYKAASQHGDSDLHVLGYCLGGTIAYEAISKLSINVASLTLLTTPLDFHCPDAPWQEMRTRSEIIKSMIRTKGNLSKEMLQSFFGKIDPNNTVGKYATFLNWEDESSNARLFVSVEDWLNSGHDLPANLVTDIIETFFVRNDISNVPDACLCIITSEKDKLVPYNAAVIKNFNNKDMNIHIINSSCGHIGMMAGRQAEKTVWQPFLNFVRA